MRNTLIVTIIIAVFLSGCHGLQNNTSQTEPKQANNEIILPVYFEIMNSFNMKHTLEMPVESVCVPDKETALQIADIVFKNLQKGGMYKNYIPIAVDYYVEDELWVVTYAVDLIPGACISFAIRKQNAEIIAIWVGE